jgi:hypothetical protein
LLKVALKHQKSNQSIKWYQNDKNAQK